MKRILIVDDQAGWRDFNSNSVLEVLGNNTDIITASCAKDGYSKLLESKENAYDYMITDMQMEGDFAPKLAGEWLIEQAQNLSFCYKSHFLMSFYLVTCTKIEMIRRDPIS